MADKQDFLRDDYINLLSNIPPSTTGAWGKMNVQQMIEHISDSFREANGKDPKDCITPAEHVERMQAFIMTDKPFKENTKNALMGEEPAEVRFADIRDSIGELKVEIADFFDVFDQDKQKIITNPFFGDLDFDHWVNLLYKQRYSPPKTVWRDRPQIRLIELIFADEFYHGDAP